MVPFLSPVRKRSLMQQWENSSKVILPCKLYRFMMMFRA